MTSTPPTRATKARPKAPLAWGISCLAGSVLLGGGLSGACGSASDPTAAMAPGSSSGSVPCNPLGFPGECLLPIPSDTFLVDDPTLPSGKRLLLPEEAGARLDSPPGRLDPSALHPADGASHLPQVLALFPEGVDDSRLVFHTDDIDASLQSSSPTFLIEADSGHPIPHFAEVDPRADSDARRALVIRPLVRLRNRTRYIVAIHGLQTPAGAPVSPPEGFRRLRDGDVIRDPSLLRLAERYEDDVFAPLSSAGIAREDLQLAWDFTTRSQQNATADMLAVREQVIEAMHLQTPVVTVTEVRDEVNEHIFRRVEGTLRVPLFTVTDEPGTALHRGPEGRVVQNGFTEVGFTLLIPPSAALRDADAPAARLIQYGHGFFGAREEVVQRARTFNRLGAVALATDWLGMSWEDSIVTIDAIVANPSETLRFVDRVHQGMAVFIAATYAAKGELLTQEALQMGPQPLYDPERIYYYGNSQGAILGGTYVALSPHIDRAAFGVGGCGLSFAMFRSRSFAGFLSFVEMTISDPLEVQKHAMLTQTSFDRIDPVTYAEHVLENTYPGGPAERQVLMQVAIGDTQFPNLASHLHARIMGLPSLQPAPRPIAGIEEAASPHPGSAVVEYDFGIDPLPDIRAIPPTAPNPGHEGVRTLDVAHRQLDAFLRPRGLAVHTCDGVCDPQ